MKKLIILAILMSTITIGKAQIFGTAQTLSKGKANAAILPTIEVRNGDNDLTLYLQGGYGLTKGVDLGIRLGIGGETYFGADLEFATAKNFSVATGFHSHSDFGLDLAGVYTFKLNSSTRLSTGLDTDIVFADEKTYVPMWIPINLEVGIKRNMVFMLEADIDTKVFDESYSMISGGIQISF